MTFRPAAAAIALSCLALAWSDVASAQPDSTAHLVGGTVALVGGDSIDQLAAHPVTAAEVALVAALLSASHLRDNQGSEEATQSVSARRAAVLIRLLAYKARLLGEQARKEDVKAAELSVLLLLRGPDKLNELLVRLGINRPAYRNWLEDLTLAKAQLGYVVEAAVVTLPASAVGETSSKKLDPASIEALRQLLASGIEEGVLRLLP
jgi:hypothetical protein